MILTALTLSSVAYFLRLVHRCKIPQLQVSLAVHNEAEYLGTATLPEGRYGQGQSRQVETDEKAFPVPEKEDIAAVFEDHNRARLHEMQALT
jgi:hypothetical protein